MYICTTQLSFTPDIITYMHFQNDGSQVEIFTPGTSNSNEIACGGNSLLFKKRDSNPQFGVNTISSLSTKLIKVLEVFQQSACATECMSLSCRKIFQHFDTILFYTVERWPFPLIQVII